MAWKLVVLQTIAFSIRLHFTAFHAGAKAIRRSLPLDPRILVTCKILVERGIAYPFVLLHRINVYQVVEDRIDGEAGDSLDAG